MLLHLNFFDIEEQEILNRAIENVDVGSIALDGLIKRLDFVMAISEDNAILDLYEGLISKIKSLSDDEWIDIRSYLPFDLLYSSEDDPDPSDFA